MAKTRKKTLHFYNHTGQLDNVVQFLESIQKKVNYINLNVSVTGKTVKISMFGPRDLQYLATDSLRELAEKFLE